MLESYIRKKNKMVKIFFKSNINIEYTLVYMGTRGLFNFMIFMFFKIFKH